MKKSLIRGMLFAMLNLVLLPLAPVSAQAQTLLSQTTWGGTGRDAANGIAVGADGSAYVVGISDSFTTDQFGQPSAAIFIVKFAPDGSLVWQRVWTASTVFGSFQGPGVALAADGSVFVTGLTNTNTSNSIDAVLLKFDPNGNLLWQRTWGGGGFDAGNAVAVALDGSAYIVGPTSSFGTGSFSLFIVKFDSAGDLVWQKIWDGAFGMAVGLAPDGSVYAAGTTPRPTGVANQDIIAMKLAPDGRMIWERTYSAGDIVDPRGGMTVASDGSIYVAGTIQAANTRIAALIIKLAPDGSLLFDRQCCGSGETAAGVGIAPDSSVYIAGTTTSGAGIDDAFVLHLLPTGKPMDAETWGGAGVDNGNGVGVASNGTVVLAATASAPPYSFLSAPKKAAMVKATLAAVSKALVDVTGTVSDPGAAVITPNGTATFAGNVDAALVRILP
jgi:Domain of unknown function (DUF5122) beta-propeller